VYEFKSDYFTAFPNTLGIPSLTLPVQESWKSDDSGKLVPATKFPTSVKLHSYFGEDFHLLRVALEAEKALRDAKMLFSRT
jgi:Asp-tRNA(Asn)/Glu-tRNA(Gln) amidotransferase A subunit family amidase